MTSSPDWASSDTDVTPSPASAAARGRGAASGALTAVLAAVAHSWAGGAAPSGPGLALLAILAVALGTFATTARAASTVPGLALLLGFGQSIGHVLLSASGHQHAAATAPGVPMIGAHLAAVAVVAVLIAIAGRLGEAVSRAVRVIAPTGRPGVPAAGDTVAHSADQPLHSTLALSVSVSHRGPPVAVH